AASPAMRATLGLADNSRISDNHPMDLPVMPPVKPMLAKSVKRIPPGMQYEAKWIQNDTDLHR
ncbi:hypothetical protein ABTX77_36475, partial [Streptomyces sp. NPDC097704]